MWCRLCGRVGNDPVLQRVEGANSRRRQHRLHVRRDSAADRRPLAGRPHQEVVSGQHAGLAADDQRGRGDRVAALRGRAPQHPDEQHRPAGQADRVHHQG